MCFSPGSMNMTGGAQDPGNNQPLPLAVPPAAVVPPATKESTNVADAQAAAIKKDPYATP